MGCDDGNTQFTRYFSIGHGSINDYFDYKVITYHFNNDHFAGNQYESIQACCRSIIDVFVE